MANLYTNNGSLHSLYRADGDSPRPIAVGEPVIIRYLYFRLAHREKGRNQLMISTHVKTEEEKSAAAEAVNYYNPLAEFGPDGVFHLADFGGRNYGHPLCYYTKSYLGETIRLTTRAMELDRLDRRTMRNLRDGLARLGGVPVFVEYLAYLSVLTAGLAAAERLVNLLNRDDAIIESHNLDLYHSAHNNRSLRPGRIVCIPDCEETEFVTSETWHLAGDNRLREHATGREYARGSYFVLEIAKAEHPPYERFDYYQHVAELLDLTNRTDNPVGVLEQGVEIARAVRDARLFDRIESVAMSPESGDSRQHLAALFRLLTPQAQRLYEHRWRHLVAMPQGDFSLEARSQ